MMTTPAAGIGLDSQARKNERLERRSASTARGVCWRVDQVLVVFRPMAQLTTRDRKSRETRQQSAKRASTKQVAKHAIRGGPKTVKKDKRGGAGRAQKG